MASSADVLVRFLADTTSLDKGVSSAGSKVKSLGRSLAGLFSTAAIGAFVSSSISAGEEVERVNAKLERAYQTMGDATGTLAKHAEDYATVLMKQTAIDDETIKSAQTKLLLFKSLSTATAQTSGVFDEATRAAADLSARGLGDMGSAATKLGKLLEDPVTNINSLSRAGVQFTAEQKAHIAQLVASGDLLGAQRYVLGEVEKRVGGAAAASATSADKAKTSFNEMKESIGTALLPAVAALAPLIADAATSFGALPAPVIAATVALAGFVAIAATIGFPITAAVVAVAALVAAALFLWNNWDQIWTWISDHPAYAIILAVLAAPLAFIISLVGAAHWLADNWESAWDLIRNAVSDAVDWIVGAFNDTVAFIAGIPGRISSALSTIWNVITAPFRSAIDEVKSIFGEIGGAFDGAISGVKSVWNSFARGWNGIDVKIPTVSLPFGIGEVGGGEFKLPHLPTLARGGIVSSPTLALIGEAGREAVVPLPASGGLGGTVYQIEINVAPGVSPAVVGATVVDQIRAYERVAGRAWRNG